MCLVNVGEDDIYVYTSFFLQCDGNIIHIPDIFGARLRYAIDQKAQTSRILFLTVDHIFPVAIDLLSHKNFPFNFRKFPF